MCAGIGGFDLAAQRQGIETLWQSEVDKQAVGVLMRHFPHVAQVGDIHGIQAGNVAPVDILVGGTPCQNLSMSGDRKGLSGEKSRLFWEFVRCVKELRPALVIWENVASALSANAGRDFHAILAAFHECGARDIAWRVLDSQYCGVPQRRRRVFLIIDFRGERAGQILLEPSSAYGNLPAGIEAPENPSPTLGTSNRGDGAQYPTTAQTLTTANNRYNHDDTYVTVGAAQENPRISGTLAASGAGGNRASGQANEFDFVVKDAAMQVRRLTPVEWERLQGFPSQWTEYMADGTPLADTPRYRMIGNAVTVNVLEWIFGRVVEFWGDA